jgi:hypothetical protein
LVTLDVSVALFVSNRVVVVLVVTDTVVLFVANIVDVSNTDS